MLTRNNYDNTNRKQQYTKYFLFLQQDGYAWSLL